MSRSIWHTYWNDFLSLIYPRLCPACARTLAAGLDFLCLSCQQSLPETQFHQQPENAFTDRFIGRVPVVHAAALYYFSKGTRVQRLIHQLKYEQRPDIGHLLGAYYGPQLRTQPTYQSVTAIVPVPLHPRKQHQRGYNQAEAFARGLATAMQIPCQPQALRRTTYSSSQTTKSRTERLASVLEAFARRDDYAPQQPHFLLVDDVMTTGATLEACALRLLEIPGAQVSMATIAIAGD
jgi:ComF family protein